eukprot:m51a1_g7475 putative C-tail anchored protein (1357) ;mRNA; r:190578-199349
MSVFPCSSPECAVFLRVSPTSIIRGKTFEWMAARGVELEHIRYAAIRAQVYLEGAEDMPHTHYAMQSPTNFLTQFLGSPQDRCVLPPPKSNDAAGVEHWHLGNDMFAQGGCGRPSRSGSAQIAKSPISGPLPQPASVVVGPTCAPGSPQLRWFEFVPDDHSRSAHGRFARMFAVVCGDGAVSGDEQCDGGPLCTASCRCPAGTTPTPLDRGCALACTARPAGACGGASCLNCSALGCLPASLGPSCCGALFVQSACVASPGCRWCGSTAASGRCSDAACARPATCYDAASLDLCEATPSPEGGTCRWCAGSCVNPASCHVASPAVQHVAVATPDGPCEIGWTDVFFDVTTDVPSEFEFDWLVMPAQFVETYVPPEVLGRTDPGVVSVSSAGSSAPYVYRFVLPRESTLPGDQWILNAYALARGVRSRPAATFYINSTLCNPTCQTRTEYQQCLSAGCAWCGAAGCANSSAECPSLSCGNTAVGSSWVAHADPRSRSNCSTEALPSTSFAAMWLWTPTAGQTERVASVCLAFRVSSATDEVSNATASIELSVHALLANGSPAQAPLWDEFLTLSHGSTGDWVLSQSLFLSGLVFNSSVWIRVRWLDACPPLELLLPPATGRRSPGPVYSVDPYSDAVDNLTAITGVLSPLLSASPCGNGELDAGETCDGGAFCSDNCSCLAGFAGDGSLGCRLVSGPAFVCRYQRLASSLTGATLLASNATSLADCEAQCCAALGCKGYVYTASAGGACTLLDSVGYATSCAVGAADCVSGIALQCATVEVAGYAVGTDNASDSAVLAGVADQLACAFACCARGLGCRAWSFDSADGSCTLVARAGWVLADASSVAGFQPAVSSNTSGECYDTEQCVGAPLGRCTFGHTAMPDQSCACVGVDAHKLVGLPTMRAQYVSETSEVEVSVALPDTAPARSNVVASMGTTVAHAMADTGACMFAATFRVPAASLPSNSACSAKLEGGDYVLTCTVTVSYLEDVTLALRKRAGDFTRNVSSTVRFHLKASRYLTSNVSSLNVMGTKAMWAVVKRSTLSVGAHGDLVTELDIATRAPESAYIDPASVVLTPRNHVTNATLLAAPGLTQVQTWRLLLSLDPSVCTLAANDTVDMAFDLVHDVATRVASSLSVSLASFESLCAVSDKTAPENQFTTTAVTSSRPALDATRTEIFLDSRVYVGVAIALPWLNVTGANAISAEATNVTIVGPAIKDGSAQLAVLDLPEFEFAQYNCTDDKYSVCFGFKLTSQHLTHDYSLSITSTIEVSELKITRSAAHRQTVSAESRIFVRQRSPEKRVQPHGAFTVAYNAPKTVVVYRTPWSAMVAAVAVAITAGVGISSAAFVVLRRCGSAPRV